MGDRDRHAPGTFCWAELRTDDPEGAARFHAELFGWEAVDMELAGGGDATTFRLLSRDVGELHRHDPRQGPPGWLCYVSVDDAGEVTRRAQDAGAEVVREPPNVYAAARTAMVEDPTGAVFALWEPRARIGATLVNDPGAMCLNQLNTSDPEEAAAFYADVFGWRIQSVGTTDRPYWGIFNGGNVNGGMMRFPSDPGSRSHRLVYFVTADIDGSAARMTDLGGTSSAPRQTSPAAASRSPWILGGDVRPLCRQPGPVSGRPEQAPPAKAALTLATSG